MAQSKASAARTTTTASRAAAKEPLVKRAPSAPLFQKENYMWMGIGAAVIALGMIIMAGGKNPNPNEFDYNLVYSKTRISVAPILIIIGLLIEVYAIFKKPKAVHQHL